MSYDLFRLLSVLVFAPSYLVVLCGLSRVLRLRRTHPRVCGLAVAAWAIVVLGGATNGAMWWAGEHVQEWGERTGLGALGIWLAFYAVASALQTTAAALLFAAILIDRRQEP